MLNKIKEKIETFINNVKEQEEEVPTYIYIYKVELQLKNGENVIYLTDDYFRDYHSFVRENKEFKQGSLIYPLSDVVSYKLTKLKDSVIEVDFDEDLNKYEKEYALNFTKNIAVLD